MWRLGPSLRTNELEAQTPMPRRLRTIFRILSVVTLLEATVGLFWIGLQMSVLAFHREAAFNFPGGPYPHLESLVYLMTSANLLFIGTLIAAAILLWKLRRRGLFLLAWTLLIECAYFLGIVAVGTYLGMNGDSARKVLASTFSVATAFGTAGLGIQLFTGFPLIAGVLIFFAYRYLGIAARTPE